MYIHIKILYVYVDLYVYISILCSIKFEMCASTQQVTLIICVDQVLLPIFVNGLAAHRV